MIQCIGTSYFRPFLLAPVNQLHLLPWATANDAAREKKNRFKRIQAFAV